jgi:hypothetical protein
MSGGVLKKLLTVSFLLVGLSANHATAKSITSKIETINVCVNKKTNAVRHTAVPKCKTTEKLLYWNTKGMQGDQGPTGPQGPRGLDGATGPQGPAGSPGQAGPQGPIGVSGQVGPAGDSGIQGATGPTGPTGATGPQGVRGPGAISIPSTNVTCSSSATPNLTTLVEISNVIQISFGCYTMSSNWTYQTTIYVKAPTGAIAEGTCSGHINGDTKPRWQTSNGTLTPLIGPDSTPASAGLCRVHIFGSSAPATQVVVMLDNNLPSPSYNFANTVAVMKGGYYFTE